MPPPNSRQHQSEASADCISSQSFLSALLSVHWLCIGYIWSYFTEIRSTCV